MFAMFKLTKVLRGMRRDRVLQILRSCLTTPVMVSAPTLGLALVVGLVVRIFQTATRIHEHGLPFIRMMVALSECLMILNTLAPFHNTALQAYPFT